MKKVLIADWLDKYGGAERTIRSLCSVFHFQKCFVLTNRMKPAEVEKTLNGQNMPIVQTFLKYTGSNFRMFLLFYFYFIRKIKIPQNIDLIISSSHAVAKGVRKSNKNQVHISYFQARNLKYIWAEYKLYFGKSHGCLRPVLKWIRKKDFEDAQRPDYIISNSNFVKEWVKKTYHRESVVIYPPVDLVNFPLQIHKQEYYVAVGRIEPYKRFDLVVKTFNQTNKKLIIIGDGSQLPLLKKMANGNIQFTGFIGSEEIYKYISHAKAFVHAGVEDFGIAPIEAQSCGTPVIAFGEGGILETVIANKTGVFFTEKTPENLLEAILKFERISFDPIAINKHAQEFDKSQFEKKIKNFVSEKVHKKS